ncbi:hypothetical protein MBEHAL_0589 [Halarchaeum acidiphilum MH1-52-1]|uniref:Nitrilase/cyanide hydratase and apolipoprotein N-acyltransferase n=1 Tax=Halarchaeum acidiphilum MH1-52-1 TaxID=1261545 RepID=U3A2H2_9EURY|nr:hypothetical protein [Halarchaeum acidiphilum]GAD51829.1 hypothetical protein MBEHAL_0589 [Halarchaeum acidiphilum MH1-52-1]
MSFACADRCDVERGVTFEGQSVLVDPAGNPIAGSADDADPTTLVETGDFAEARRKQLASHADVFGDRWPETYDLDAVAYSANVRSRSVTSR